MDLSLSREAGWLLRNPSVQSALFHRHPCHRRGSERRRLVLLQSRRPLLSARRTIPAGLLVPRLLTSAHDSCADLVVCHFLGLDP
jgi:hypothetical protein